MNCSDFIEYKLNEAYDFASGLSKKKEEFGFGYPFLTFKEVFNNYFIPDELVELANTTEKERERCSVKRGDLFLTRTSEKLEELGMSSVALKDYKNATFNGFTKRLRLNGKVKVLPEYAGYYFRSPKFRAEVTSMSSMTTRASLNNDMMSKLSIVVPDIEVQKRIADILLSLDRKIELNNKMNKTLEKMAHTLFKRWFVDFEFPNEDGEPYKSSGGQMVASELRMIPKGWDIKRIDEVSDVSIGKTPPRKESQWFSDTDNKDDIRWISIRDLGNSGTYINKTSERLTGKAVSKFNVKIIPDNTVVLSFKLTVGRVAITVGEMLSNEAIAHFIINDYGQLPSEYIYLYLKDFNYNKLGSTSSIATAVNSKIVKTIPVVVPNKDIIINFQSIIEPIFKQIKENSLEIESLTELRDSLLPKLISGEIRVEEIEANL